MGTIIQNMRWFGIKKIFCSDGCVDAYNPKSSASMASIGNVQVVETDLLSLISTNNLPVYGAVLNGKTLELKLYPKKDLF